MRLLPRINLKREVWQGGPQFGEVLEAQLSPRQSVTTGGPATTGQAPADDSLAVNLLLLLR
ncbi:MAG: hypothetical protein ACRDLP_15655 [Solirubrobacteraceae bacterium]